MTVIHVVFYPQAAPMITGPPVHQTVVQLDNAMFSCAATGTPTPDLMWFKTGQGSELAVLLTSSEGIIINTSLGDGLVSGELHILGVGPPDAAEYMCVVENQAGMDSVTAALVVHG